MTQTWRKGAWLSSNFSKITSFPSTTEMVAFMRSVPNEKWDFCEYFPDTSTLVRPYFDAEYKVPAAQVRSCARADTGFRDYLLMLIRKAYPTERVVVMDSSGYTDTHSSYKHSFRFVVHGDPVSVSQNKELVQVLNASSDDPSLSFDNTCYTRKQHIRTVWSTKRPKKGPPEPWRRFRYVTAGGEDPLPLSLEDTIIQCGAAVNTAAVANAPKRVISMRLGWASTGPQNPPDMPIESIRAVHALVSRCGEKGATGIHWDPRVMHDGRSPTLVVRSRSHNCRIRRAPHKSNTVFYNVNRKRRAIFQSCWDADCRADVARGVADELPVVSMGIKLADLTDEECASIFYK